MNTTLDQHQNVFLDHFDRLERRLNRELPRWVHRLRRASMARFAELGFPGPKSEDWRWTDVTPIVTTPFQPVDAPGATGVSPVPADAPPIVDRQLGEGPRLVFIDGVFQPALSWSDGLPFAARLTSLTRALRSEPDLLEPHLGRHASRDQAFVALNAALFRDGGLLYVPAGTVVEQPVHLLHVVTPHERPVAVHPRHLLVLGRHARATVVESYVHVSDLTKPTNGIGGMQAVPRDGARGLDSGTEYLTNAVTEVALDVDARLDHYCVQRESSAAFHLGNLAASQARDSHLSSHLIALGGALARHESSTRLDGEGCHATLNGLYMPRGEQHIDCRTRIDHARPHCTSHELYKGILDDRAVGVFNGKIFVHPDAQKTDAKQTNQALLLSPLATIHTKPQLEIFADDVRCTHGATVGQLDAEALFYLRSRGLSDDHARSLLIYAFAGGVIEQMRLAAVRHEVERILLAARGLLLDVATENAA